MIAPKIQVLGVYSLCVTDGLVREEAECRYADPSAAEETEVRQELESVVLVEVLVRNADAQFDVGAFTQPKDGVDPAMWQVAWNEAYLTEDGNRLAEKPRRGSQPKDFMRIAFFIHCWQPDSPLMSSYGEIECPKVQQMPRRLAYLVPYEGVD